MVPRMHFIAKMCPSSLKMIPQIAKKYTLELPGPSWKSRDRPEVIQSPSKHLPDLKNDTKSYQKLCHGGPSTRRGAGGRGRSPQDIIYTSFIWGKLVQIRQLDCCWLLAPEFNKTKLVHTYAHDGHFYAISYILTQIATFARNQLHFDAISYILIIKNLNTSFNLIRFDIIQYKTIKCNTF